MKKTKIFAVILAALMSASVMPQTTQLPKLSVTAYAASKLPAPKNLKATAGKTKVTLKWSAVDGANGYIVYKYNSSAQKYKRYKKVTGTTCTVKGLKQDTKYKFKVAAYVKKERKDCCTNLVQGCFSYNKG